MLTLGIAGTLIASLGTLGQTQQAAAASRATAPAIITPASGSGLADATVTAIRRAPGVSAAVPVTNTIVYVDHNGSPDIWNARYVPGPDLPTVINLPIVAGSLAALIGTDTVAVPAGNWRLGQVIIIWLADSAQVRLRVVALYANQVDLDRTMLLPMELRASHTTAPLATAIYLKLSPGTGPGHAAHAAAAAGEGTITSTASFQSSSNAQQPHFDNLALIAILGMSIAYTSIAIANTLVMANAARRRELATLRLSGATRRQVLRMIALEACITTGIATILGGAVIATAIIGLPASLASTAPSVHLDIPWLPITLITLGCLLTAVLASLTPAAISLRQGAAELARAGNRPTCAHVAGVLARRRARPVLWGRATPVSRSRDRTRLEAPGGRFVRTADAARARNIQRSVSNAAIAVGSGLGGLVLAANSTLAFARLVAGMGVAYLLATVAFVTLPEWPARWRAACGPGAPSAPARRHTGIMRSLRIDAALTYRYIPGVKVVTGYAK